MPGIVHLEVPAGDTARAQTFWGSLFGWQFQPMEGPMEYHMTRVDDTTGAAIYPADGDARGPRAYLDVDDIRAGVARVQELGGGVVQDSAPVPGMGWFAIVTDTEGNEFGLWQTDESAPMPG